MQFFHQLLLHGHRNSQLTVTSWSTKSLEWLERNPRDQYTETTRYFDMNYSKKFYSIVFTGILACGLALTHVRAQSAAPAPAATTTPAAKTPGPGAPIPPAAGNRNQPIRLDARATRFYGMVWGIDSLSVKLVESGEMIRFSYRVVDADKAKVINDKKSTPSLIDPQAGVKLVVPELEQVGMLRQSATPEVG